MDLAALQTTLSALQASQRAIEVVGHNVANTNTPGFTRRRVELVSVGGATTPTAWSRDLGPGRGVSVEQITRVRDQHLEAQARRERATGATYGVLSDVLAGIERALPEPGTDGLSAALGRFWSAWGDLSRRPDDLPTRTGVLEQAGALIGRFHDAAGRIATVHADAAATARGAADEANALAGQVAELNRAIRSSQVAGTNADDLRDKRDLLVERLATSVGATTRAQDDGTIDVLVGGSTLVTGTTVRALEVVAVPDPALASLGLDRFEARWAGDGLPASVGGELAGALAGTGDVVARYIGALDRTAATLVSTVNAIHATGRGIDGGSGRAFFDPAGATAAGLALSTDVAGQPRHLAAGALGAGELDGSIAQGLADLASSRTGADAELRSLVVQLGTEARVTFQRADVQDRVIEQVDRARKAVSGVNLDEELVALVQAQHAYSAAGRVMTTVDTLLQTLISQTGLVGR